MKIDVRRRVAPPGAFRVRLGPGGRAAWTSAEGLHVDGALAAPGVVAELRWGPERLAALFTGGPPPGEDLGIELFPGRVDGAAFAWAGSDLVVADLAARRLVRVSAADLAREPLAAQLDDAGDPHFKPRIAPSPDGRRIAYTCRPSGAAELRVADLEAGTWKTLTELPAGGIPFWAPDSRRLGILMSDPRGLSGIVVVGIPDGKDDLLWQSDLVAPLVEPLWGESILFFRTDGPAHPYTRTGPSRLSSLDVGSGAVTDLSEPGAFEGDLRRQSDGSFLIDGGPAALEVLVK